MDQLKQWFGEETLRAREDRLRRFWAGEGRVTYSCQTNQFDYRQVLDGIDDPRMQAVLEVGHFHSAGVRWQDGYDLLAGRIALVHIKDQVGPKPVPFGTGEIDLPEIFERLSADGYAGDVVVEMELEADVLKHYADGVEYLLANCKGAAL